MKEKTNNKPQAAVTSAKGTGSHKRTLVGTVVSDKMSKTIVVKVDRRVRHALYRKFVTTSTKYKAHDEMGQGKVGDLVQIVESRPLSREKRWALSSIVRKVVQTVTLAD